MALTINSQPTVTLAARNLFTCLRPMIYEVDSDDSTCVNIIADVFIGGTYHSTRTLPVNGAKTATFQFNGLYESIIMNGLQSNIDFRLPTMGSTAPTAGTEWSKSVQVKFYEELNTAGELTTNWVADGAGTPDVSSSTVNVVVYPSQRNDEDHLDSEIGDFVVMEDPTTNGVGAFMNQTGTNSNPRRVTSTSEAFLFAVLVNGDYRVRVQEYDSSGSSLGITTAASINSTGTFVWIIPSGPAYLGFSLNASTVKYRVYMEYDTGGSTWVLCSDYSWYLIDDSCYGFVKMVHYLSQNGGMDSFLLRGEYEQIRETAEVAEYTRAPDPTTYDPRQRYRSKLSVSGFDRYRVELPDLDQDEMKHYTDMMYSPFHFVDMEDGSGGRRHGAFFFGRPQIPYKGSRVVAYEAQTAEFKLFDITRHGF